MTNQALTRDPSYAAEIKLIHTAAKALALLRGRTWVLPDDVKELFGPVACGRVLLTPHAAARGLDAAAVLAELLDRLPTPALSGV